MTDQSQFLATYLPLRGAVMEICRMLLGNTEEAEDVTQDVYVKLWEQREHLEEVRAPRSYVITLARNRCLDRMRSLEYKLKEGNEPEDWQAGQDSTNPQSLLIAKEELERLSRWVDSLPSSQQEIFRLRHYDMLSNPEIAEQLGIQETTVRSIVSRLRKEARKLFDTAH